jgi:hypothetical protein
VCAFHEYSSGRSSIGRPPPACARALRRCDQEKRTETETHRGEIFVLALVPREFMEILKFMGDFVEKFFLQGAEYYILQLAVLSYENFLRSALSLALCFCSISFCDTRRRKSDYHLHFWCRLCCLDFSFLKFI